MRDHSKDLILRYGFIDRGGREVFGVSTAQAKLCTGEVTTSKYLGEFRIDREKGTVKVTKWEKNP